jgi:hypothetical protein
LLLPEHPWARRPKIPRQVCFFRRGVNGGNFNIGPIPRS